MNHSDFYKALVMGEDSQGHDFVQKMFSVLEEEENE